MAITRKTTLAELAVLVSEKLKSHGLDVILVGGAVVSIYTDNKYESGDLDFVIEQALFNPRKVDAAMAELGFRRDKARVFLHPECRYAVDFGRGPAAIGEEIVRSPGEVSSPRGKVRLYTPTQCVMDRLAAYYHFHDPQGLEQALLVAESHPVNLEQIRQWSSKEGMEARFEDFLLRMKQQ